MIKNRLWDRVVPISEIKEQDPTKVCQVQKSKGCSHVDSFLCVPSSCNIRRPEEHKEDHHV